MSKIITAFRLIKECKLAFLGCSVLKNLNFLFPDKIYLKLIFFLKTGNKLNLEKPETFNEKLQWLKLYDRNPLYTELVDKYSVKKYVARIIGDEHIIPTIGVWRNVDDIDFDNLPKQFVLKTTNGSGGGDVLICRNKETFNVNRARKILKKSMKKNVYKLWREWPYKNIKPQIIAEKYLEDENGELNDYKVLCFGGKPKMTELHRGRFNVHTQDLYDENWNLLPITQGIPLSGIAVDKPVFFEKMMTLSALLSESIPHVRVDWYFVHNQLYFGEMTFYDGSGFYEFKPKEYNKIVGDWIKLPPKNA